VQGANFGEPFVTWDTYQAPVPEPTGMILVAIAMCGAGMRRRRRPV
jgi:hypothetical protein